MLWMELAEKDEADEDTKDEVDSMVGEREERDGGGEGCGVMLGEGLGVRQWKGP